MKSDSIVTRSWIVINEEIEMVENKVVCELRNGSFNQLRKFLKFEDLKYCEKWIMRNLNN